MTTRDSSQLDVSYLDMQASVGVTKHMGGYDATNELLSLCHIEDAREVLYVGSGIGVGPAYIARCFGCHVVAVDISAKMIEWSRKRVRQAGVESQVELRTADVLDLPFDSDRFDIVLSENVLAFLEDKPRAIRECVRVTKPGGRVGMNEPVWIKEPTEELIAQVRAIAPFVPTLVSWRALWEQSGLWRVESLPN
jgi:ubiquinone/menaquinone biosynthesis C-methylase UbiE